MKVIYLNKGSLEYIFEDIKEINRKTISKKNIFLRLYDLQSNKEFVKHFDTESQKDRFKNKLKHSRRLMIVDENDTEFLR